VEHGLGGCTGDELALHIALDAVEGAQLDGDADDPLADIELGLIDDPQRDADFFRDVLLQDDDVVCLFVPALDGLESEDSTLRAIGLANLHPSRWFLPFEP
jgi:hypothetical protein